MNDDVRSRRVTRRGTIDTDVEIAFTGEATVAELAASLGLGLPLGIDGGIYSGDRTLAEIAIANGAVVGDSLAPSANPGPVLHQIAGLSAGGSVGLRVGRFAVGAAGPQRADLRSGAVAAPRFLLDVAAPGPVTVRAAATDNVVIDGDRLGGQTELGNRWIDTDGAVFRMSPRGAARVHPPVGDDGTHRRAIEPRSTATAPAPIQIPAPLVGASKRGARKLGGLQVATTIQLQEARRRMLHYRRHASPDVAEIIARANSAALLWERAGTDPDAWLVNVGIGDDAWGPVVDANGAPDEILNAIREASVLPQVPLTLDLRGIAAVNLVGPRHATAAIARWIIVQLAVLQGPDSCVLNVSTDHFAAWDWMKWLPHLDGSAHETVVVHDGGRTPTVRSNQVVITLHDGSSPLDGPTVDVGSDGRLGVRVLGRENQTGFAVGIGQPRAVDLSRRLARFHRGAEGRLPNRLGLGGLLGFDDPVRLAEQIAERWNLHVNASDVIVGRTSDGPATLDLSRPIFLTGRAGSGRRTSLRTIALALAASAAPNRLSLAFVSPSADTFGTLVSLPHVWHAGHDLPTSRPPEGRAVLIFDEVASVLAADPAGREKLQNLWNDGVGLVLANRTSPGLLSSGVIPVGARRIVLHHDSQQMAIDSAGGSTIDDQRTAVAGRAWYVTAGEPRIIQIAIADSLPTKSTEHLRVTAFSLVERSESTSGLDRRTLARWAAAISEAARRTGALGSATPD